MRKLFITALFIFGLLTTSKAQFYHGGGVLCFDCSTSIEAGAILSNVSGMDDASSKIGFYIGFYQYKYISDKFSLRMGTSYNNLGAKVKGADKPLIFHSVNLPITLHYLINDNIQVFAGGELGTNFFGELPKFEDNETISDYIDFRDNFTLFDASVVVGVGYIILNSIDINLKYNLGVTNIYKPESTFDDFNMKKNWLTLSLGYTFRD